MPKTVEIPASLIEAAGVALYGTTWQRQISRDLGIDDRRVRNWAKLARDGGSFRVSRGLVSDLIALLRRRPAVLEGAAQALAALLGD